MRRRIPAVILVVVLMGCVCAYDNLRYGRVTLPAQYYQNRYSQASANAPKLDHVVIILEENKPKRTIIGSDDAPYINSLAKKYAQTANYYAVTNPSLPNYIALTSGTTAGISNDCNPPGGPCVANVPNIADRLEQAHKSWKEYAESMPRPCAANNNGDYAAKHNPFMYYPDIANNKNRCDAHVVPYTRLAADLGTTASMPDYAFVTPNLCNDMHNCSIRTGDAWLSRHVPQILNTPAFTGQNSLLVITWDEGNVLNNHIPTIFAGPAAKQGYTATAYYSHYSLLHTIENNWGLRPLTQNDRNAPLMTDLLRQDIH